MMLKYGEGGWDERGMKDRFSSVRCSLRHWAPCLNLQLRSMLCSSTLWGQSTPSFLPSTLWGQSEPQKPPSMTCSTWYGRQHPWRVALSPAKNCWQATTSCHDTSHNQRKQSSGEKAKGLESWLNCQQQLWLMVMSKKQQTFTFFLTLLYKSGWGEMI